MLDDRRALRVGIAVLCAVAAAAVAVLTLDRIELGPKITVEVAFEHAGDLFEGADVQVAGRRIGRVSSVRLDRSGGVRVSLRIDRDRAGWAAVNGEFFVSSRGVLGEPYLEVGPPPGGAEPERELRDGDRMRGVDPVRLERFLARSVLYLAYSRLFWEEVGPVWRELAAAISELSTTLGEVEPGPASYARLSASLRGVGSEIDAWRETLDQGDFDAATLRRVVARARTLASRAEAELRGLGEDLTAVAGDVERIRAALPDDLGARFATALGRARLAIARAESAVILARGLLLAVESGDGTVGALLNDPEFIDDAKKLGKIIKRQPWRVIGPPQTR